MRKELSEQQLNELANSVIVYGQVKGEIKAEIEHYAKTQYQKGLLHGSLWGIGVGLLISMIAVRRVRCGFSRWVVARGALANSE